MASEDDVTSFAPVIQRLQQLDWIAAVALPREEKTRARAAIELVIDGLLARLGHLPEGIKSGAAPGT